MIMLFGDKTKTELSLINPDNKVIKLEVISYNEWMRIRKDDIACLYKMDINVFETPIYLLKNGNYLFEYTKNSYAFIFSSDEDINLFLNNENYFTTSIIIEKSKVYYNYGLKSSKVKKLMEEKPTEISGYLSKSPMLHFKLYKLKNGHYLRAEERVKDSGIYDGYWFPDLETFEWHYKNSYCP